MTSLMQVQSLGYAMLVTWLLISLQLCAGPCSVDAYLHRYGRHVCSSSSSNDATSGVRMESYCQPYFKPFFTRCQPQGYLCTKYSTLYRMAYRTRNVVQENAGPTYTCCPGWRQHNQQATSCNEPVCTIECRNNGRCVAPESCACPSGYSGQYCQKVSCSVECANDGYCRTPDTCTCSGGWQGDTCEEPLCLRPCENGGRCVSPDSCACPNGWSGQYCQNDVNECQTDAHGCHHRCKNAEGSYTCSCHPGFTLDADGLSCSICLACSPEYVALQDKVNRIEQDMGVMQAKNVSKQSQADQGSLPLNDMQLSQLELITSLSEQISMLEERLDDCTCKDYRSGLRQIPRRRINRERRSDEGRRKQSENTNI
ncbi:epidermal growth factor-like protein 7 [Asterias amurensis]|uniref:epidermal growth factor-like protein 7 n=1 Tax=Asterias amurensis TaxID=7602 RepID=UPI003AB124A6